MTRNGPTTKLEARQDSLEPVSEKLLEAWALAYQRWDGRYFAFNSYPQACSIDNSTMRHAKERIRTFTTSTWRSRISAYFASIELGEAIIHKIVSTDDAPPDAIEVWVDAYSRDNLLTAAYYRPDLLQEAHIFQVSVPDDPLIEGNRSETYPNGVRVGCGGRVIVVRLVLDQRRMVACLLLAFIIVVPALCLVVGMLIGCLDRCIAICAGLLSFVTTVALLLDWIIARQ
ncbi:MAG: hypothetical protein M1813_004975 [Trichoglossum hirsutum]|nr:MAG: hypothetical protein M1813_004975 [Trichoglossum hirsutum]